MNSNKYNANVVIFDKINDIAILKIDFEDGQIFNNVIPYCIKTEIIDVGSSVFT
ncbi:MAG: hypothetical protein IPN79_14845 [Saprospiraceae bacterium]|nr:hypothetical protein [Saprospiraceae bacterium]